ncbi:kinesin-like protein KIF28 [Glandiceps talaboti]
MRIPIEFILQNHAIFRNKGNKHVTLTPCNDQACVFVNGERVKESKVLQNGNRIALGTRHLFLFYLPNNTEDPKYTYAGAQKEILDKSAFLGDSSDHDRSELIAKIKTAWNMVTEANVISKELDKKTNFEVTLVNEELDNECEQCEVFVKITNSEYDTVALWSSEEFEVKKYCMDDMWNRYIDGHMDWDYEKENDPFWIDPSREQLIGKVHAHLQCLQRKVTIKHPYAIISREMKVAGYLVVEIMPNADEDCADLSFKLKIVSAFDVPPRFNKVFFCYNPDVAGLDEGQKQTDDFEYDGQIHPNFRYEEVIRVNEDCTFNDPLIIDVWGRQRDARREQGLPNEETMLSMMDFEDRKDNEKPLYRDVAQAVDFYRNMLEKVNKADEKNETTLPLDEVKTMLGI